MMPCHGHLQPVSRPFNALTRLAAWLHGKHIRWRQQTPAASRRGARLELGAFLNMFRGVALRHAASPHPDAAPRKCRQGRHLYLPRIATTSLQLLMLTSCTSKPYIMPSTLVMSINLSQCQSEPPVARKPCICTLHETRSIWLALCPLSRSIPTLW
jgi:hypothetical protein